jgi:prepilin-type N-terminal cleavage/methylation domain-containing protein
MISRNLFQEGETPMKSNKGFTLIELAVVLAIIAVLAAILTPMVTNYLDQARVSRALADTKTIAQAVNLFKRDMGYYPVYTSLASAKTGTTSKYLAGPSTATDPTAVGAGFAAILAASSQDIVTQLNTAWADLPNAANDKNPGHISFRGPYIGALDADPWGNKYVVADLTSATNRAFVISAGPNGSLDTSASQGLLTFTCTGDDVCSTIN